MIRNLFNEEWKEIEFDEKISDKEKFKISNYGRVINCKKKDKEYLKKESFTNGYVFLSLRQKENGKTTGRYVHKLVARHFIEKENEEQVYVLHLNYDKSDNRVENLKWATKREKELHQFKNPVFIKATKNKKTSYKLSEGKVKIIKRQLRNKRTRITMIAKRFGVSDMQIHRIKSGENWAHVKI
ncbi:NUMOD4 domain-containing protein [Polaribacter sp. Asnod1-A03]|uniref:NUMOD4 domain-containing protein n=1 Tax=Polaribacter sp. Asnod1-A03 TaxID=3160581 RepID=UPI0038700264